MRHVFNTAHLPHLQVVTRLIDATALDFIAVGGFVAGRGRGVHRSVRFVVRRLVKESVMQIAFQNGIQFFLFWYKLKNHILWKSEKIDFIAIVLTDWGS